jgi:23S rRNA (cytidine1920-2'-O)/16S rRNA (cytidine1409-2'-O)-methyltransferase
MAARLRLDQTLVDRGLCASREQAKRAVMAGSVRVNGHPAGKPSQWIRAEDRVELLAGEKFVSRGGLKLEHALTEFQINPAGWTVLDLGASTGGFTDCLVQRGAARVFAIDVGQGQLAWKLRQDSRVMEKTNARHLTPAAFPPPFAPVDLIVVDCSFISLRSVLPPVLPLLREGGQVVALIKPQFEAGKAEADRGRGVITDPVVHQRVIDELRAFICAETPLRWARLTESPILGPAGNKEFLVLLEKETPAH